MSLSRDIDCGGIVESNSDFLHNAFSSMLHRISPRKSQPFVAVNCAANPDTLIERAVIMADADGLIDLQHLFTSGETLSADVMTLRLQGDSGTLNLADGGAAPIGEAGSQNSAKPAINPQSLAQTERETLARNG